MCTCFGLLSTAQQPERKEFLGVRHVGKRSRRVGGGLGAGAEASARPLLSLLPGCTVLGELLPIVPSVDICRHDEMSSQAERPEPKILCMPRPDASGHAAARQDWTFHQGAALYVSRQACAAIAVSNGIADIDYIAKCERPGYRILSHLRRTVGNERHFARDDQNTQNHR